MADYNWVTGRIATGAALATAEDVSALIADGVTAVVDCRAEYDDGPLFAGRDEITYLWNPTDDDGQPKHPVWFRKTIRFALEELSHRHTAVYLHCAAGVNRGPSSAYAVLRALGLDRPTAEGLIRRVRPQVGLAYMDDADRAVALYWNRENPHAVD